MQSSALCWRSLCVQTSRCESFCRGEPRIESGWVQNKSKTKVVMLQRVNNFQYFQVADSSCQ